MGCPIMALIRDSFKNFLPLPSFRYQCRYMTVDLKIRFNLVSAREMSVIGT